MAHPTGTSVIGALSRRRLLRRGATLAAGLAAGGFLGLSFDRRGAADEGGMQMSGGRGVPRAPFDKNAMLIEPGVRRSSNGALQTSLRVAYAYKGHRGLSALSQDL